MKRFPAYLALLLALLLTFSSCFGGDKPSTNTSDTIDITSQVDSPDSTTPENITDAPDETSVTSDDTQETFPPIDLDFEPLNTDIDGNVANPEKTIHPLLYRVTDAKGHQIWLFGSIHVGILTMTELPPYVMNAYKNASALAVEVDILEAQKDEPIMTDALSRLLYTDGSTIRDHISEELYQEAVAIFRLHQIYNSALDRYMPAFWSNLIDSFLTENDQISSNYGVDLTLLQKAKADYKTIISIESLVSQYQMMGDWSAELQESLLFSSVINYKNPVAATYQLEQMLYAWCTGDATLLRDLCSNDIEDLEGIDKQIYEEYTKTMMTDRDAKMTAFARDCLAEGKEVFICVGAAHVIGENGIVVRLIAEGYTVEAIQG